MSENGFVNSFMQNEEMSELIVGGMLSNSPCVPKTHFTGKKISLRLMEKSDTESIISWRNNPRVFKNFIYQKPFTREGHLKWIETMIDTGKAVQFVIVENSSGKQIGSTYLRDIDLQHKKAEFGIFIGDDDSINRGFGTEACQIICKYGFEFMHLHKIFLRAFETNRLAIRSYEKSGFVHEGTFADDVFINGKYHNIVMMGLINPADCQFK